MERARAARSRSRLHQDGIRAFVMDTDAVMALDVLAPRQNSAA